MLATCDGTGAVVEKMSCPLGCFENEPRCRNVAPSNGLAQFLDAVPVAPDLDLTADGWTIDTSNGMITNAGNEQRVVPSFSVAAPAGGAPIRVFVVNRAIVGNVRVPTSSKAALAIVAHEDIHVLGVITIEAGAGSFDVAGCNGGDGSAQLASGQCRMYGSGGGGHATAGARGGGIDAFAAGGAPGGVSGTDTLVPLRGGCAGGGMDVTNGPHEIGLSGGGAIQLTSNTTITVSGTIDVTGGHFDPYPGGPTGCGEGTNGGGGGGGILLEAPVIQLEASARLLARGGDGWGALPNQGDQYNAYGGVGASLAGAATAGGDAHYSSAQTYLSGGGGGGGWGRIRINTADGIYAKASSAVEDAVLTTGVVSTR